MIKLISSLWFLAAIIFVVLLSGCFNSANEGRKINFQAQIGIYEIDLHKTDLGDYKKDSNIYKELRIIFNADSTFKMNMKVPFMYDSIGKWKAGNMEEWNFLYYKKWKYSNRETGEQFTRPTIIDSQYTFLLNSATPQQGAKPVVNIYFKKVNQK